ncbi:hypothetical protein KEJ48_07040, partial [Candidatus Bathyarchaeota archaeon]|nr:hypothetical protein [Candidatus Bathyarchaeota archaeon]
IREGDEILIQLGYEEDLKNVFNGFVDDLESDVARVRVLGLDSVSKLLNTRVNQVYEGQMAGQIVSDLAGKASVVVENAADGIRFPQYTVDDSKNIYEHMWDLANKCGFDLYMNAENKLVFKSYEGKEPHILEYGKNIIYIEAYKYEPKLTQVLVRGESPASFKGADKAHWLTKRLVEGSAGSGSKLLIVDPTARDKNTAHKIAEAKLNSLTKTISGIAKIVGNPDIDLGDTVEIRGFKQAYMNGEYQVRGVEHVLNRKEGFITILGFRR